MLPWAFAEQLKTASHFIVVSKVERFECLQYVVENMASDSKYVAIFAA